ncbi:hypothetical protein F511_09965 [Dorcoceras hygrometricum]|uniref:Uncharacterized protein n=1 Tax=Dorcoceras hygrometricum TaxID=472368 RepID=A0A2Z7CIF7_9LAMI|nr:hypothetical protein F511_09965 [Dorcoceras hygrometricum]
MLNTFSSISVRELETSTCVTLNDSGIQLAMSSQLPVTTKTHFRTCHWTMAKHLETSSHDPIGIIDSSFKNQSNMVSVQYGPFISYIPTESNIIDKSRVSRGSIAMHISWRSNSDIVYATSIGYPCTSASGESSTSKHRLLHASDLTQSRHLMTLTESINGSKSLSIMHAQKISMFRTNETWYFALQKLVSSSGGPYPLLDGPIDWELA